MMIQIELGIKRIFDMIFAIIGGIIALPVILIVILVIRHVSPQDPAIFKQKRVGYQGKEFTILKLRTMTNEKDGEGKLLPDELRLKKWGKIIRATNIDELTQILNILKGEMSWIGPRPLLPKEMLVMTAQEQQKRQSMLPGITGWEAVNEGKSANRSEMAQFDLFYVDNWSLLFDIKIFIKTVLIIFLKLRPSDDIRAPKMTEDQIVNESERK